MISCKRVFNWIGENKELPNITCTKVDSFSDNDKNIMDGSQGIKNKERDGRKQRLGCVRIVEWRRKLQDI